MFTTRPEILGSFGCVASTHWLASGAGMAVLELGGNAFDAAVAAGFVLQIVEPHLNGPGGEVPILLVTADSKTPQAICGQGPSPAGATIEYYRDLGLEVMPGSGLLATCVPGAFDAWLLLLRDYGTMSLSDVMSYAIGYAENGYPLVPRIVEQIDAVREMFEDEWVTSAELYLADGLPKPFSLFRNPELAQTWRRLLREAEAAGGNRERQIDAARRSWSQGFIAETIDAFCRTTDVMDSSGRRHRGVLSGADMAKWQASVEAPVSYDYHGYRVFKCGVWSQGPVFLQQLALLKNFDLAAMDPLGADFVHTVTECSKLAFADREAYYGDPDFVDVPLSQLLDDKYNRERAKLVGSRASRELRPGKVSGFAGRLVTPPEAETNAETAKRQRAAGGGEPTVKRGDTCHLDIVDRWGNMVSATPSGGWLHSSPIIPGLGFCLGSRAQMFWLEPGLPASLAPGKRPRTTLSPNLAFRDDKPCLAFGTPGGDYQDQWSLVFFLRHVHHAMNLQESIDAPMFHNDHMPSSFWPRTWQPASLTTEDRMPERSVSALRRKGHRLTLTGPWSQGRLTAVARAEGMLKAAANPRGMQGYALGR
ncbi:MAG TPA: gamma-glutamyltransferase family protein [Dongiaceae bacterium]|jgi:gamma-glutamyltranspeptidase/glutathione hydrolase|nr:gamma-glutamyltransferase family protein [Dongiaceae bacterium]